MGGQHTSGLPAGRSLESPCVRDTGALGLWDKSPHLGFRGLVPLDKRAHSSLTKES